MVTGKSDVGRCQLKLYDKVKDRGSHFKFLVAYLTLKQTPNWMWSLEFESDFIVCDQLRNVGLMSNFKNTLDDTLDQILFIAPYRPGNDRRKKTGRPENTIMALQC